MSLDPVDVDQIELLALRTVAEAVSTGLSLDGTVEYCLEQTLAHLQLDFGCIYVRRQAYLLRVASRGLSLPTPGTLLPLAEAEWAQRPFVCQQGGEVAGRAPDDVGGKSWMSLPLRVGRHLSGVLLVGGYHRGHNELPPLPVARRLAEHIAVAIDNASRFEQVRGILNDTRDVIFRTDALGRWTYLNEAWHETIGEPVVMALGRRAVSYVEPDTRRKLGKGLEALVPRGAVIGRCTLPFLLRDGKTKWLDVQARLVRDDRGQVIGAAGVLRDVSQAVRQSRELYRANQELRQRALELEALNRRLAEADRLKSEFLATVSHELRTPLGIVMGYTELLQDGVPDPATPGQREYLDLIEGGSQRLQKLILQLLDLARIEAGTSAVDGEPTPLREAWQQAARRLADEAAAAHVDLTGPDEAVQPVVLAQPERLTQVCEILLANAIKFNHQGGHVAVHLALQSGPEPVLNGTPAPAGPAAFAQVTVIDDGEGVPLERQAQLFQKFVQADGGDTRQHGGLGLGLVIGKALVEMMGGRIGLHSAGPGRGTAVGFTVPLVAAS